MKYTLLEIVQEILSDMDSDEVTSISDNAEATQVAHIVKETYFHLISQLDIPEHKTLFKLKETDATTPTLMYMPDTSLRLEWVQYDKKHDPGSFVGGIFQGDAFDITESSYFVFLEYLPPDTFFENMNRKKWTGTDVATYTWTTASGDTFDIKYSTNASPSSYTVIEDYWVLFNSINTEISADYLESDLTWCYGVKVPTFTLSDSFTPDLDAGEFNWFINEAKKAAFAKLKQVRDPIADERARRGWVRSQRAKDRMPVNEPFYTKFNNFGRNR